MSRTCPLCGKTKPGEALFCDDCTRRIRTDYEVDLPANETKASETPVPNTGPIPETSVIAAAGSTPVLVAGENDPPTYNPPVSQPERKKRRRGPLLFLLVILLLGGGFLVFNETVRKRNLERSGWETALRLNSVGGYLAYMEAYPQGTHFDEAQEGLFRLKSEEATIWERLKSSGNTAELHDFLRDQPDSPYAPLVQVRLDSLSWMAALQVNTPESYSDYLAQSQRGSLRGDYALEAQKRYNMLYQSFPVEGAMLDSIRTVVSGFYASLSGSNHEVVFQYLAPIVNRFFNSGATSRERITGELLMTRTRAQGATLSFVPDIESIQYEHLSSGSYLVNVPLTKSYSKEGNSERVPGYIVHMELNPDFQIGSIHETKPHPDAP